MRNVVYFFCIMLFLFSCKKETNNDPLALPDSYSNQAPGKSANDMLTAAKYAALQVQIQYMPGYAFAPETITSLTNFLNSICNKPGGITITQSQIDITGDSVDDDHIKAIEKKYRTVYTNGTTLAVYVLVTDGFNTTTDSSITNYDGYTFRNTSICVFGKAVSYYTSTHAQLVNSECTVIQHEFGHVMGLVNDGSPMQRPHEDAAHQHHCNNMNCLMYYIGSGSLKLDSNCVSDLKANGSK